MATVHLLVIVGAAFLLQETQGGWLENKIAALRASLSHPILEITHEIEAKAAELEKKKSELEKEKTELSLKVAALPDNCRSEQLDFHFAIWKQWDLEGCLNLTGDWKDGLLLGLKGAIMAVNVTHEFDIISEEFLKCPVKHFFKMFSCYYDKIKEFSSELDTIKDEAEGFVKEAEGVSVSMKKDFDDCVGIPNTLKDKIVKHLKNLKC